MSARSLSLVASPAAESLLEVGPGVTGVEGAEHVL